MYTDTIRESLARAGRIGAADPRHVEAWMRLEHSTLDGLSPAAFDAEVRQSLACIEASSPSENEDLARSFGL